MIVPSRSRSQSAAVSPLAVAPSSTSLTTSIKGAYSRVDPHVGNKTNQFTVQMQFFDY